MRPRPRRAGYSLRDLFVVVAIIGALLAVVMPAIRRAQEKSRQHQCMNNLKHIVLGLQNYHDTFRMFPMGAMHSGENTGGEPPLTAQLGPSWCFGILPFMESNNYYDRIIVSQRAGGPKRHQFCADDMNAHLASWSVEPQSQDETTVRRGPSVHVRWITFTAPPVPCPGWRRPRGRLRCRPTSVSRAVAIWTPTLRTTGPARGPTPAGVGTSRESNRVYRNLAKGIGATPGGIVDVQRHAATV